MKLIKSKKGLALLAVLAIVAISAVGAYAYFTSTGTGSGTASTGTSANFTVAQDAFSVSYPAVTLYPGVNSQPLQGTVTNPGAGHQQLNTITASIQAPTLAPLASGPNACTAADYALSGAGWAVAANGLSAVKTVNQDLAPAGVYNFSGLSVSMLNRADTVAGDGSGNQDKCKNATVNLKYDAA